MSSYCNGVVFSSCRVSLWEGDPSCGINGIDRSRVPVGYGREPLNVQVTDTQTFTPATKSLRPRARWLFPWDQRWQVNGAK